MTISESEVVSKSSETFYNGEEQTQVLKKWLAILEYELKFSDHRRCNKRDAMEKERLRVINFLYQ